MRLSGTAAGPKRTRAPGYLEGTRSPWPGVRPDQRSDRKPLVIESASRPPIPEARPQPLAAGSGGETYSGRTSGNRIVSRLPLPTTMTVHRSWVQSSCTERRWIMLLTCVSAGEQSVRERPMDDCARVVLVGKVDLVVDAVEAEHGDFSSLNRRQDLLAEGRLLTDSADTACRPPCPRTLATHAAARPARSIISLGRRRGRRERVLRLR